MAVKMVPSDTEVLAQLDLGEPPEELLEWAKENLNEDAETRCQVLQELRDMIYGKIIEILILASDDKINYFQKEENVHLIELTMLFSCVS